MLTVRNLHTYYGNIHVLKGLSLHVDEGEIVTIIGANGAGKSTLLKTLAGLIVPRRGEIIFDGQEIFPRRRDRKERNTDAQRKIGFREALSFVRPRAGADKLSADKIMRLGISLIPEGRSIFGKLSVGDNLLLGAFSRSDRAAISEDLERVLSLFPVLRERYRQRGDTLSGGEQQMLAIGRALMGKPSLIMLDEPSMGLAPKVVFQVFSAIYDLIETRTATILLVEQNARAALTVADRAYIMEMGKIIFDGERRTLMNNSEVKRAYLGKGYREVAQ
jgi:branched-chain amino acid transport system ATP-binding protein